MKVLFVCLGNICRSPTAEGIFRRELAHAGWQDRVGVDSCGVGHWHVGSSPDLRAQAAAKQRVSISVAQELASSSPRILWISTMYWVWIAITCVPCKP